MKLLHVADLHIGKIVNEFSMLEDQKYILEQILQTAIVQKVDAILIAGDLYDRSIPPADAVAVFDHFLTQALGHQIRMIMIAGNHDSQERVSFLEDVLQGQGLYISGVPKEELKTVRLQNTEIVLLPFCKPSQVQCSTSEEAVRKLLSGYWEKEKEQTGDEKKSRILVTHYFVTDSGREPELSDSEATIHVGSLDNVDASVFEGFDYVALGHIHKKQQIGQRPVYYAGAPLKYSFGEAGSIKGMLLVTVGDEGLKRVEELPLTPLHDMRKIKGTLQELLKQGREEGEKPSTMCRHVLPMKGSSLIQWRPFGVFIRMRCRLSVPEGKKSRWSFIQELWREGDPYGKGMPVLCFRIFMQKSKNRK